MSDLKKTLMEHISEEHIIEMTSDMVRIPSYAGIPNQETGVAKYVKSVFDANGIPCYLKEVADGRCNVIATLDSGKPGKTLMFNSHIDTVPPNGWEEAFEPKIVDGKLYGRGSEDDKGPLACIVEAMLAIKETGALKQGKIVLTGVLDEEQNSIGTIDVVESGIAADGAIIAECTHLQIQTCQRGLEWLKFHFIGKTVHGSRQREGINAIAKAVSFINAMEEKLIPKVFARTHPLLKEATVNYGVIHGGTQLSTVAGECDLYVDTRFLPDQQYDDVLGEFQELLDKLAAKDPQFKCEMSVCEASVMKEGYLHLSFETEPDHPLVTTLQNVVGSVTGEDAEVFGVPYWSDGALLSRYSHIPTVILGPGGGTAHTDHEHIPVEELTQAALVYALAAVDFC